MLLKILSRLPIVILHNAQSTLNALQTLLFNAKNTKRSMNVSGMSKYAQIFNRNALKLKKYAPEE